LNILHYASVAQNGGVRQAFSLCIVDILVLINAIEQAN